MSAENSKTNPTFVSFGNSLAVFVVGYNSCHDSTVTSLPSHSAIPGRRVCFSSGFSFSIRVSINRMPNQSPEPTWLDASVFPTGRGLLFGLVLTWLSFFR